MAVCGQRERKKLFINRIITEPAGDYANVGSREWGIGNR